MGRIRRAVCSAAAAAVMAVGISAAGFLAPRGASVAAAQSPGQPEPALTGVWRGAYACAQGVTGLTLTIEAGPYGLTALFDFYAVRENPQVPSGRFKMVGTYDATSRILVLHPREWIDQPPGYLTVGIRAHVDLEWGVMLGGVIETYACTWVRLSRDRGAA